VVYFSLPATRRKDTNFKYNLVEGFAIVPADNFKFRLLRQ